jgi:starch synthase
MFTLSHPFGNQNVRQALAALNNAELLSRFHTTVYWDSTWRVNSLLPSAIRSELNRRAYPQVERRQVSLSPAREGGRLLLHKLGVRIAPFSPWLIAEKLDAATARYVARHSPKAVYAYSGVALQTFRSAKRQGAICVYEQQSGYCRYTVKLFQEEALLKPEYAETMPGRNYPAPLLEDRDEELDLADHIIVPSQHVNDTLKTSPASGRDVRIIPYGTHEATSPIRPLGQPKRARLRVLFVGALSQGKGIAYAFDAIELLRGATEFTIIGRKVGTSTAVDAVVKKYRWISSIPNDRILEEMAQHDVLVLPSLTEGLALVIGEALSRGLPVIATAATGGLEIIRDGQDGFIVPIRSAQAIAEKLEILNKDRERLDWMSQSARLRAREFSWERYRSLLSSTLKRIVEL